MLQVQGMKIVTHAFNLPIKLIVLCQSMYENLQDICAATGFSANLLLVPKLLTH